MNKNIFIKIISLFVLAFLLSFNTCFADETENSEYVNNNIEVNNNVDEESIRYKQELGIVINDCVTEIKEQLKAIDKKVNGLDKTEEYEKYPAIRLNIDTPFFGLNSMIDQKLKIKNDVSTVDVAKGYSIKDIVNNMSMKLPDFEIGSIVVSTREVKLDDTISEEDAKVCILKLVQYISQIQNLNELLTKRINNIFEGYILEEKTKSISDINKKLEEISKNMSAKDDDILTIKLLANTEKTSEILKEYYEINNKVYNLKTLLNNVLLSNEELENINKDAVSLELDSINYIKNINYEINSLTDNLDINLLLNNSRNNLEAKQKNMEEYIDKSILKEVHEDGENKEDGTNQTITEKQQYFVTSKYIVEYENTLINSLEEKIRYYIHEDIKNEETENDNYNINEVSDEEKKSLLKDVIKLYNEYINKENKFYLDNLNYILKDTTYKLAKLPEYADTTTVKDIKYIYISLPEEIDRLLNMYSTKSSTLLEVLTINLKERLDRIVNSNIRINIEYNKFILS